MTIAWKRTFGSPRNARPNRTLASRMLSYGIPSVPAVVVGWLQNAGSRVLLAIALTFSDVAIAGVAIKVAAIYSFVVYSFRMAWEPFSMAKLADLESDPGVYSRALEWYVAIMFLSAGIAVLLGPYIVAVLAPPTYAAGGWVATFFVLGQFWVGMTNVLVIGIHGARLTSRLLPVYACGLLVNVAVLFAAAPHMGVTAAAVGFLAGSICSALLALYFSNKNFNTQFSTKLVWWTGLATVIFGTVWYHVLINFREVAQSLATATGLFAIGVLFLLAVLGVVIFGSFEPGRAAAMWKTAGLVLRSRIESR